MSLPHVSLAVTVSIYSTRAAVEGQPGSRVKLLDQELGQGDLVVRFQGLVPVLPVQHQVLIRVGVLGRRKQRSVDPDFSGCGKQEGNPVPEGTALNTGG